MTESETPATARPTHRSRVPRWLRVLIPMVLALAWLGVAGVGGSSFGEVNEVASNDRAQQLPASAEATAVNDLQDDFRDDGIVPAVVVYERNGGLTAADQALIEQQVEQFGTIDGVEADSVSPAVFSDDGEAAELFVSLNTDSDVAIRCCTWRAIKRPYATISDGGMPPGLP